jgi:predicted ester cyclase
VSLEDNKAIMRAYVETIFNQQQLDRAGELVAADYRDHAALPGQAPGLQGAKHKWAVYLAGIPDLWVTIEELVAEGDEVGCAGPMRAPTGGCWASRLPASGCGSAASASSVWPGGRIAEHWEQLDRLTLMQQPGVLPTPRAGTP